MFLITKQNSSSGFGNLDDEVLCNSDLRMVDDEESDFFDGSLV